MQIDIARIGAQLAKTMIASLRSDSRKVRALAASEAAKLAQALAEIARLLAAGEIDNYEAAVLLRIQRNASEAVFAALAEVSRLSARKAVGLGLGAVIQLVDGAIGVPLIASLTKGK